MKNKRLRITVVRRRSCIPSHQTWSGLNNSEFIFKQCTTRTCVHVHINDFVLCYKCKVLTIMMMLSTIMPMVIILSMLGDISISMIVYQHYQMPYTTYQHATLFCSCTTVHYQQYTYLSRSLHVHSPAGGQIRTSLKPLARGAWVISNCCFYYFLIW